MFLVSGGVGEKMSEWSRWRVWLAEMAISNARLLVKWQKSDHYKKYRELKWFLLAASTAAQIKINLWTLSSLRGSSWSAISWKRCHCGRDRQTAHTFDEVVLLVTKRLEYCGVSIDWPEFVLDLVHYLGVQFAKRFVHYKQSDHLGQQLEI